MIPTAKRRLQRLEAHGHVRLDDYYWLRERENPEVMQYLESENAWTEAAMGHTMAVQEALFEEIKARIKQDDASVPYRFDGYFYYTRFEKETEYPLYCRREGSMDASEEVMLDVNELANGHDFFDVRGVEVSSGGDVLSFATDDVGRRIYTIHFKNLTTREVLPDVIPATTGNVAWANDNKTIFYAKQVPETLRSYQIYRHRLGTDPQTDDLVFEETDETYSTYVSRTKSKQYIIIASVQTQSSEYRYLSANTPAGHFELFMPRERGLEYHVDHFGEHFYVRTNWRAKNFRLMRCPVTHTGRGHWAEVIPHRQDVLLEGFEVFSHHFVLHERAKGLTQLRVRRWDGSGEHHLDFGEPAYLAYIGTNRELDTQVLRYGYTSMTTPISVYDYDMETRDTVLRKRDDVLGSFDPDDYRTERLHARAADGTEVPISLVYRADNPRNGGNPLLLYGYGSYGLSMDATFASPRLSLIDRGFIFAIAHVRGGQEMGRWWYEDGKLLKKKNTFTDFIACAEYLVAEGYASRDNLFAQGRSAGGLLMAAVVNMRPDLFKGVVAEVPFVDVVTTMLDDSIPLTTAEYDEWGDPNTKEHYEYILSYSPYDNIEPKKYPHLLVTTGLHDSQVQYWEPVKWVAKLRAVKTDDNRLLLRANLEAGHGGASGRFRRYRETALVYAFLLDVAGIELATP